MTSVETARFLRCHPPFDRAPADLVTAVAEAARAEFLPAGSLILAEGTTAPDDVFILQSGHAVVLDGEDVVDELVPGDVFGLVSVLSGRPVGRDVRAASHVVVHRVPAEAVLPLLEGRDGLRFVATTVRRALTGAATTSPDRTFAGRSVAAVMRRAVVVPAATSVRAAVLEMTRTGATAVLVRDGSGALGICTDHDLRSRVLAPGVSPESAVGGVATPDAVVVDPAAALGEALGLMTEGAFRHLPVVDATGVVLGLVEDADLLASHATSPLDLRRAVGRTTSEDALVDVAGRLPDAWVRASTGGLEATHVSAAMSSVVEGVVRRAVALAVEGTGLDGTFDWLVVGSLGRRESMPSSDVDTAVVWAPELGTQQQAALARLAARVDATLARCGIGVDGNGLASHDSRASRSQQAWRAALDRWTAHPDDPDALAYLSALLDTRALTSGRHAAPLLADLQAAAAPRNTALARRLAWAALSVRPQTAPLREFWGLDRQRHLDLKRTGSAPVTHLARWAGFAAGSGARDTAGRLAAADAAGVLVGDEAATLQEVHAQVQTVRLRHQVEDLRAGRAPGDDVAVTDLGPLTRRELRELFRAVLHVQDGVRARLEADRPH